MKVKDLMNKAHLYSPQKVTVHEYGSMATYTTVDRYMFDLGSAEEVERVLALKVNTFRCSDAGLEIYAE